MRHADEGLGLAADGERHPRGKAPFGVEGANDISWPCVFLRVCVCVCVCVCWNAPESCFFRAARNVFCA